ncbi:uncharacterized protein LOC118204694 [Stegodyphus dumicola]|uniref:uncharacterized protein LOC118204694 n=1 Tax=Stegodyphus dumicola TaxID=202533 RepID=UPI0015A81389|nr:uncharacterized protein LOC118204694 [Stegodyphus dumicola]
MFYFPRNPSRRRLWETAFRRENWTASNSSTLCSNHFIMGKPSNDPNHPDYVPSIFKHKVQDRQTEKEKVARFQKLAERNKIIHQSSVTGNEGISSIEAFAVDHCCQFKDVITMTDLTKDDIDKLESSNKAFAAHLEMLRKNEKSFSSVILNSQKMCNFYTKFPSTQFFLRLLTYIMSGWIPKTRTVLEHHEQLLLMIMKLRLGLLNEDLAYRFNIGTSTASRIFQEWITRMAVVLLPFIHWPSMKTVKKNMPKCFIEGNLGQVSCILDCTEIFIDKAFNLDVRSQTFSNYKHHNTVKFMIACSPTGCVTFISKLYGGRISDKEITKLSGFLDKVENGTVILTDRGFQIDELVASKGATVIMPSSTKGKQQLGAAEVNSRKISRVRVHIERCIGRLKTYRILKCTWPISLLKNSTADKVLTVISALCNISRPELIKI